MAKWKHDQPDQVLTLDSAEVLPLAVMAVARDAFLKKAESDDVIADVIADLIRRSEVGVERYGMPLYTFNGRDAVADALAEALDAFMYMTQAVMEGEATIENAGDEAREAMNLSIALAIKIKALQNKIQMAGYE